MALDARKQLTRLAALWQEWGMSEERYVVRDKFGTYYRPIDGGQGGAYEERERHEMDRRTAHLVVGHCADSREARVYKLKSKPKPKAPREVFVVLPKDGNINDAGLCGSESAARAICFADSGERVVRYVLDEGEK